MGGGAPDLAWFEMFPVVGDRQTVITCRKIAVRRLLTALTPETFPSRLQSHRLTERPNPFQSSCSLTGVETSSPEVSARVRMSRMGFKLSTVGNMVSRAVGLLVPILVRVE